MGNELNLTDDQKQRIEAAKSPEEKVRIITEAMDAGIELSDKQLDAVSGGVRIPATHAAIDQEWDAIQVVYDKFGANVAADIAFDRGLIPFKNEGMSGGNYFDTHRGIARCRAWMHNELDGKHGSLSSKYSL